MYFFPQKKKKGKEENTESILGLNSLTGDLFIKRSMDHEQQKEYGLCVKVMPANTFGNREKRSLQVPEDSKENNVAYISLVVVDENDNGPKFPEKELTSGKFSSFAYTCKPWYLWHLLKNNH